MSKFEKRLHTIERALLLLPTCSCHQPPRRWCESCETARIRNDALKAASSMRTALDADERFDR